MENKCLTYLKKSKPKVKPTANLVEYGAIKLPSKVFAEVRQDAAKFKSNAGKDAVTAHNEYVLQEVYCSTACAELRQEKTAALDSYRTLYLTKLPFEEPKEYLEKYTQGLQAISDFYNTKIKEAQNPLDDAANTLKKAIQSIDHTYISYKEYLEICAARFK